MSQTALPLGSLLARSLGLCCLFVVTGAPDCEISVNQDDAGACSVVRCAEGTTCVELDDGTAECQPNAAEACACSFGERCDLACSTEGDVCVDGFCQAAAEPGCQSDADCGDGFICVIAEPAGDNTAARPAGPIGTCIPFVVEPTCTSDADCVDGQVCLFDNATEPASDGDNEDARPAAPQGYCGYATFGCELMDCAEGYTCVEDERGQGSCVPLQASCWDDSQCQEGQVCVLSDAPSCPEGANCLVAPGGHCEDIVIEDPTCASDADCGDGQHCEFQDAVCPDGASCRMARAGFCVDDVVTCYSDDDCADDEHCAFANWCPDGAQCLVAVSGSCEADAVVGCEVIRCAAGYLCVEDDAGNGSCVEDIVTGCEVIRCAAGYICVEDDAGNGSCVEDIVTGCEVMRCNAETTCVEDEAGNGACVPNEPIGCYSDEQCASGSCSAAEECLPPPGCGPDSDGFVACPAVCYGYCR